MRVTSIGHAGLRIDTKVARVLIDPWLSPEGAYQASWFQYPDPAHVLSDELRNPDAVVLSHEHLDHLDGWFLRQLPTHVPVFVPRYPSPVIRRKLASAGRTLVHECDPWEEIEVGPGVTVFFVSEDSPMNHDSAIVVRINDRTLLNLNDARLTPEQFRQARARVGGTIDAFAAQGSGASWHPMVYDLDSGAKRRISAEKRLAKFRYFSAAIRLLEPRVTLPFAGPPCFLDPELAENNEEMDPPGVFPDQFQVADWLQLQGLSDVAVLLPGDAWDVEAGARDADPTWLGFSPGQRSDYLADYAAKKQSVIADVKARHPFPERSLWEAFISYFDGLLEMSSYFNNRIGMRVGFEVTGPGGGCWAVDFREAGRGVYDDLGSCGYVYQLHSRWLAPILRGDVLWEDFLLSLRFRARRDPDIHNEHLLGLLKFAEPEALRAVEEYESTTAESERIVIEAEGCQYEVQRYCPHAGGDLLETGEVLPGKRLLCLNHYYEFDLETGRCLNGSSPPLTTRMLQRESSL